MHVGGQETSQPTLIICPVNKQCLQPYRKEAPKVKCRPCLAPSGTLPKYPYSKDHKANSKLPTCGPSLPTIVQSSPRILCTHQLASSHHACYVLTYRRQGHRHAHRI